MKVKVKSLSRVRLLVTPWTVARQGPLSTGFPRQEYWSGLSLLSPGDLPDPESESPGVISCNGRQILYHSANREAQGATTERATVNLFSKPTVIGVGEAPALLGIRIIRRYHARPNFIFPSKVNIDPITRLAYFKLIQFFFKTTQIGFIKIINAKPVYPLPQTFNF